MTAQHLNHLSNDGTSPAPPALRVAHLRVSYGTATPALNDVSFTLQPGTITGLIGVNGAGKSTLFNAIMGLVPPVSGDVYAHGGPQSIA
ncbi:ATP-binding cassette domain-containing protein, partial [Corynebacterium falsenii]|uniref:ATP-binding cassette domain-containing protein n=1 Tax=Corynebacterium falsenii TaxID=108486 RepID=UPI001D2F77D0